jgi:hypothetical protein
MKTKLFLILALAVSCSAFGQEFKGDRVNIIIEGHAVHTSIKKDSLTLAEVKEFFDYTDVLFVGKSKMLDRYLYTKSEVYYRPGVALFRKPHIYKKVNGDYIKIKS